MRRRPGLACVFGGALVVQTSCSPAPRKDYDHGEGAGGAGAHGSSTADAGSTSGSTSTTSSAWGTGGAGAADCAALPAGTSPGASTPQVLAVEPPDWRFGDVAVDSERVYWTASLQSSSTGKISAVAKSGGDVAVLNDFDNPDSLAVDEGYVYWTRASSNGGVMRMAKDGSAPTKLGSSPAAFSIAIDDEAVYWSDLQQGAVYRVAKDGGSAEEIAHGNAPQGLALHGDYIYWADYLSLRVLRAPKTGGAEEVVATSNSAPRGVAVNCQAVFWSNDATDPSLYRLLSGSSEPELLANALGNTRLVLDAEHVYGQSSQRVTQADGVVTSLIEPPIAGKGFAIDADSYYAAEEGPEHRIVKIPR